MVYSPSRVESQGIGWKAILSGAMLSVVFMLCAEVISRALGTVALAPGLSAVAWFLAGMVTMRWQPDTRPGSPALGSAGAIVLFGMAEIAALSRSETPIPVGPATFFIAVLGLVAFVLTFLGARVAKILRERRMAR